MYTNHFNLEVLPFESTPDPAFFYPGPQYRETLAAMIHCVASRKSLMVVSGPIGSGKTTLGRTLTRYLSEGTQLISILHPFSARGELISFVAQQVGLKGLTGSKLLQVEELNKRLIQLTNQGKRILIIVDEAQLLSSEDMEEIRLLTNLETETTKLIQIILLGQPELIQHLQATEARPLRQRLSSVKILKPLERSQVINYVRHRLKVAGGDPELFSPEALEAVALASTGIPRLINQICDQALLNAFSGEAGLVDRTMVEQVVSEMTAGQGLPAQLPPEDEAEEEQVDADDSSPSGEYPAPPRAMEFRETTYPDETAPSEEPGEKASGKPAPEPEEDYSPAAPEEDLEPEDDSFFSGGFRAPESEEKSTSLGEEYGIEMGPLFRPGGIDVEEDEAKGQEREIPREGPAIKDAKPLNEKARDEASMFQGGNDLETLSSPSKLKTWIPAVLLLVLALIALGASLWIFFNQI